ncbi:MAG: c-type cytochrome [Bryobacteraceae bacterium]|nr:c-type cytochrome [Bryobacteraceae bacterium]
MRILVSGLLLTVTGPEAYGQPGFQPEIPRVWDEAALAEWATPVAGLNLRPKHISEKEYYAQRVENLRTYPVYAPGREPEGYWRRLQQTGPRALIERSELKTEEDWIRAGKRVFDEMDLLHLRTLDRKYINEVRNGSEAPSRMLPDGTLFGMRWVPTSEGVALSFSNCSFCHVKFLPDGTRVAGAPFQTVAPRPPETFRVWPLISRVQLSKGVLVGSPPFFMPGEPIGTQLYRAYGVPWRKDDIHKSLKSATQTDYEALDLAARAGGIPRWNGSPLFPAKVPDLIGIKDRKYIDHTATHLHRGVGDLMRYAALVTSAEAAEFGPHKMVGKATRRPGLRVPDEALFALALYLYSLQPPANPNVFDARAAAGQKLFERECARCHVPPLYTSNQLTLAEGFEMPKNRPASLDVLPLTVGTDPGLALRTRKGTGYYKVPSLKGVWYRERYLHDGSVASLEEMFHPERLKETHEPGGFRPVGVKTRAIPGHPFGLHLKAEERAQIVAFLRTL